MARRRAKSSISRLPVEQREHVERLLREGRLTLDEMIADLQARFPGEAAADVSRSALHRYDQAFAELTERMREIDHASNALVGEFGDSLGEKASTLLTNAVVTLVTDVALKKQAEDKVDVETARKLARAAKDALDTKRVDVNVRKAIAAEAREKALRDAASRVDAAAQERGLTAEDAKFWREQVLMGM